MTTAHAISSNFVKIATTGEINLPLQCAFRATLAADKANVTGNGAVYTIPFDQEDFDQNSDFNTGTGVFVAPKDGIYYFCASALFADTVNKEVMYVSIYNSTTTTTLIHQVDNRPSPGNKDMSLFVSGTVDLDSGDNIVAKTQVYGAGSDICDLSSAAAWTFFCGHLVC